MNSEYKLVVGYDLEKGGADYRLPRSDSPVVLFDRAKDPHEVNNIAGKKPDIVKEMMDMLVV